MAVADYRFIPKEGFHPLLLGMTGEQIERAMDEAPKVAKSRLLPSEEDWFFPGSYARVSMRDGRLVEGVGHTARQTLVQRPIAVRS